MLPFLKAKKSSGPDVVVAMRKPDGKTEDMSSSVHPGLMAAAEDLIRAVESKDAEAVAHALEAAYMVCDVDDEPEGSEGME